MLQQLLIPDIKEETARYTTAIPNVTHKNAGVMVIVPMNVSIAVIIATIIPLIIEIPAQLVLQ